MALGVYPSFEQTGPGGTAMLGTAPTIQALLASLAQAGSSTGGYGGSPQGLGYPGGGQVVSSGPSVGNQGAPYYPPTTFGGSQGGTQPSGATSPIVTPGGPAPTSGGSGGGGGGRGGISLPPGQSFNQPVQPGPTVGSTRGTDVGNLVSSFLSTQQHGGGGTGGGSGTGGSAVGKGQTAAESAQGFANANAAATPDFNKSVQLATDVLGGFPTGLVTDLLSSAFPGLNPAGSAFNVSGPQLSQAQIAQVQRAYAQYGPAYANALLGQMRSLVNSGLSGQPGTPGGGIPSRGSATPIGGFGMTPEGALSANFTSPGFSTVNPTAYGYGGGGGGGGGPSDPGQHGTEAGGGGGSSGSGGLGSNRSY